MYSSCPAVGEVDFGVGDVTALADLEAVRRVIRAADLYIWDLRGDISKRTSLPHGAIVNRLR